VTQSAIQNAHAAKAERVHRLAMNQLINKIHDNNGSTWREAYVAAFTLHWFMDESAMPLSTTNDEPLQLVIGKRTYIVE
jgi:hypothetical protein